MLTNGEYLAYDELGLEVRLHHVVVGFCMAQSEALHVRVKKFQLTGARSTSPPYFQGGVPRRGGVVAVGMKES